jgi:hypothetical protein
MGLDPYHSLTLITTTIRIARFTRVWICGTVALLLSPVRVAAVARVLIVRHVERDGEGRGEVGARSACRQPTSAGSRRRRSDEVDGLKCCDMAVVVAEKRAERQRERERGG